MKDSDTTTTPAPRTGTVSVERLHELLHDDLSFETGSRNGLSSHLSMELVALHALGADETELQRRFDGYAQHASVPRADPGTLERLHAQVWSQGIEQAVRVHAAALVDSPATHWMHAPIRLAYAIETEHAGQVANSLLSWQADHSPFQVAAPSGGDRSMRQVLDALSVEPTLAEAWTWDLAEAASQPSVAPILDQVRLDGSSLDDLAAAALAVHVARDDFGSLHMVTGTHAARVLAPHLDEHAAAVLTARMTQTIAAAYVAIGCPPAASLDHLDALRAVDLPTWSRIHTAAVRIPDAHVAKLVYTCQREQHATGDPLYRWVAARAAQLLTTEGSGRV